MKLVLVTSVEEFHENILKLFKKAGIHSFSESDIDGHKNGASLLMANSWFPGEKGGNKSRMYFSFAAEDEIEALFELLKIYNQNLETNNPIKAVVLPIEKYL